MVGLAALLAVVLFGTVGYVVIERWTLAESVYMVVLSITTTGFQEVRPLSSGGRLLTTLVIVLGLLTLGYLGGSMAQLAIENTLTGRRGMQRKLSRLRDHYIVCGYGRMGEHICADLERAGAPFVVVEEDDELIPALEASGYRYVLGSSSSDDVLTQARITEAKGLVSVVGSDADNVFTTLSAKALNPQILVVTRAISEDAEPKLRKAGADRVIKPLETAGRRMSQLLLRPGVVEFLDAVVQRDSEDISLQEVDVTEGSVLAGKQLSELAKIPQLDVMIVAVRSSTRGLSFNPRGNFRIESGDRVVALGPANALHALASACTLSNA